MENTFRYMKCAQSAMVLGVPVWQAQEYLNLFRTYKRCVWSVGLCDNDSKLLGYALMQEYTPDAMRVYWEKGHTIQTRVRAKIFKKLNVSHGPVVCKPESAALVHDAFCQYLLSLNERKRYTEIDITPAYYDDVRQPFDILTRIYKSYGFEEERLHTFVVRSDQSLDTLRRRLDRGKKNKINRALRQGIEIDDANDHKDVKRYWLIRCDNWRRNRQAIVPLHHFIDTWDSLHTSGAFRIFISHCGGHDLAGQTLFLSKTDVELSGVAVSDYNITHSLCGNDALQWYIIQWAHENGFINVDYIGATPNDPDPKHRAIHHFKKSWGGDLIEYQKFVLKSNNIGTMLYNTVRKVKLLLSKNRKKGNDTNE